NTCATLQGGATCALDLVFHPAATGAAMAQLEVSADGVPMTTAALTGTGLALSDLAIVPSPHDFGAVAVGRSATKTFTVTNSGTATTSALTITVLGANTSHYQLASNTCAGSMLPANASCSFDLVFTPT